MPVAGQSAPPRGPGVEMDASRPTTAEPKPPDDEKGNAKEGDKGSDEDGKAKGKEKEDEKEKEKRKGNET